MRGGYEALRNEWRVRGKEGDGACEGVRDGMRGSGDRVRGVHAGMREESRHARVRVMACEGGVWVAWEQ